MAPSIACNKVKYDRVGAMLAIADHQRKGKEAKRYYYCRLCRCYHITSQPQKWAK